MKNWFKSAFALIVVLVVAAMAYFVNPEPKSNPIRYTKIITTKVVKFPYLASVERSMFVEKVL